MSKREMLDFNDACDAAARSCPQYRGEWDIEDRDILLSDVKPSQLVKHWWACDTLWFYGYSEELGSDALDVFKKYKAFKVLKKAEKIMKKQADKPMSVRDVFGAMRKGEL